MSAPQFGTSGLRGRVEALTAALITDHLRSFLRHCPTGGRLYLGQDLRPSSPRIARDVAQAALAEGVAVIDCGALPTPALALAAAEAGAAAVMVTGSHIPADRNGLKFYSSLGEISKTDEAAIRAGLGAPTRATPPGALSQDPGARARYRARALAAFGPGALAGQRIGLYAHSTVGAEDLLAILSGLGAEVVVLGQSRQFIPLDTEAVAPEVTAQIRAWVRAHRLDALVSADGDADRPLLADEQGALVAGDVIGQITAETLGAQVVVTPVTANSGVLQKGFADVIRTRVGSPFVLAAMAEAEARGAQVAGYEANGGFLLGFDARGPAGELPALRTRDAVLPLLSLLHSARGMPLSARIAREPAVITRAIRLQEIAPERAGALLARLEHMPEARAPLLRALGTAALQGLDATDGLRLIFAGGEALHLRASGNAPEFRLYSEAATAARATALLQAAEPLIRAAL